MGSVAAENVPAGAPTSEAVGNAPDVYGMVDVLANNPQRTLAFLAIATAGEPITVPEQLQFLNERQGDAPEKMFTDTHQNTFHSYMRVLVKSGLVQMLGSRTRRGREQEPYLWAPVPSVTPAAIAVAACLVDTEIHMTDSSLALVLGASHDGTQEKMPTTALKIYETVLSQDVISVANIVRISSASESRVNGVLRDLSARGALIANRPAPFPERSICITPPKPHVVGRVQHGHGIPVARLIHEATTRLTRSGTITTTMAQLIAAVRALDQRYGVDDIRGHMQRSMPGNIVFTDKEYYASRGGGAYGKVRYTLPDERRNDILELVGKINGVADGSLTELAVARAEEILATPADVTYLLRKARHRMEPARALTDGSRVINRRWRDRAACLTLDEETLAAFSPPGTQGPSLVQMERAKAICARCPVIDSCRTWAHETGQRDGVWGGQTPAERRASRVLHLRLHYAALNRARQP